MLTHTYCVIEDACVGPLEIGPPVCADPSWSLWNATKATSTSFNYFCCLGSQIGLQSGECGLALLIGPPPTNVAVPVCWNSSHQPAILQVQSPRTYVNSCRESLGFDLGALLSPDDLSYNFGLPSFFVPRPPVNFFNNVQ